MIIRYEVIRYVLQYSVYYYNKAYLFCFEYTAIFFKPPDDKIIRSFYNILRYYSVRLGKESNGWLNLSGGSKKYGFKISENIRYIPNRSSFK